MTLYIVVRIGCIECGVSSDVIGVFETRERADEVAASVPDSWKMEGGEGFVEVFEKEVGRMYEWVKESA